MNPDRLKEIKKIQACVPFIDNGAGVAETMQAMRDLIEQHQRDQADIEIMQDVLDKLCSATVGPACLEHLGVAGENEVRLRIEMADRARKSCRCWKEAAAALEGK